MSLAYRTYSDVELYEFLRVDSMREAAFAEIYARYNQRVYMYCRKILADDTAADDVFQDTFIRFLRSVQDEREMTNVAAFLLRIARNLCLNWKRDHKSRSVEFQDFHLPNTDHQVESREVAQLITMALDLLSEEYREALVLQLYHGMSYEEIGEHMQVPVSTVRNWVVRSKKRMRDILAPYFEDKELPGL